jgi:hypothetical protein
VSLLYLANFAKTKGRGETLSSALAFCRLHDWRYLAKIEMSKFVSVENGQKKAAENRLKFEVL